eukprot:m51a1_g9318 putative ras-like c3 botulinum toxin substrate 1 (762) ;mRNA; f:127783-130966
MTQQPDPLRVKVVLVGDPDVGKTSALLTFICATPPEQYDPGGHAAFDPIRAQAYAGAQVAVVFFAITDPPSLSHAKTKARTAAWLQEVRKCAPAECLVVAVGTHVDMRGQAGAASTTSSDEGLSAAQEMGAAKYAEINAMNPVESRAMFWDVARAALAPRPVSPQSSAGGRSPLGSSNSQKPSVPPKPPTTPAPPPPAATDPKATAAAAAPAAVAPQQQVAVPREMSGGRLARPALLLSSAPQMSDSKLEVAMPPLTDRGPRSPREVPFADEREKPPRKSPRDGLEPKELGNRSVSASSVAAQPLRSSPRDHEGSPPELLKRAPPPQQVFSVDVQRFPRQDSPPELLKRVAPPAQGQQQQQIAFCVDVPKGARQQLMAADAVVVKRVKPVFNAYVFRGIAATSTRANAWPQSQEYVSLVVKTKGPRCVLHTADTHSQHPLRKSETFAVAHDGVVAVLDSSRYFVVSCEPPGAALGLGFCSRPESAAFVAEWSLRNYMAKNCKGVRMFARRPAKDEQLRQSSSSGQMPHAQLSPSRKSLLHAFTRKKGAASDSDSPHASSDSDFTPTPSPLYCSLSTPDAPVSPLFPGQKAEPLGPEDREGQNMAISMVRQRLADNRARKAEEARQREREAAEAKARRIESFILERAKIRETAQIVRRRLPEILARMDPERAPHVEPEVLLFLNAKRPPTQPPPPPPARSRSPATRSSMPASVGSNAGSRAAAAQNAGSAPLPRIHRASHAVPVEPRRSEAGASRLNDEELY